MWGTRAGRLTSPRKQEHIALSPFFRHSQLGARGNVVDFILASCHEQSWKRRNEGDCFDITGVKYACCPGAKGLSLPTPMSTLWVI